MPAVIFFCTTRGIFLQLTIKREYKRRILFPFIDHFHNLPIYTYTRVHLFFFYKLPSSIVQSYFHIWLMKCDTAKLQRCLLLKRRKMPKQRKICPALIARLVLDNHSTGFVITTSHETGLQHLTAAICQCHRHVLIS